MPERVDMEIGERLFAVDRKQWRTWLAANHDRTKEIWLVRYKKHTGVVCVPYDDAVEEALCFGWIDGLVKREDDATYVIRFTPRRPGSVWSVSNKQRVARMVGAGQMTEAGLAMVREGKRSGAWDRAEEMEDFSVVPPPLEAALAANPAARRFYDRLTPSQRKHYNGWVVCAKRPETRRRRAGIVADRCAEQRRPGIA